MLTKLIASLTVYAGTMAVGIAVSIYGWGLTPHSWWWIIGGGTFGYVAVGVMRAIVYEERK